MFNCMNSTTLIYTHKNSVKEQKHIRVGVRDRNGSLRTHPPTHSRSHLYASISCIANN
jgi:hypothetical protein